MKKAQTGINKAPIFQTTLMKRQAATQKKKAAPVDASEVSNNVGSDIGGNEFLGKPDKLASTLP